MTDRPTVAILPLTSGPKLAQVLDAHDALVDRLRWSYQKLKALGILQGTIADQLEMRQLEEALLDGYLHPERRIEEMPPSHGLGL